MLTTLKGNSVWPEDYTSLWGRMSFNWVALLIRKGTNMTLNENDIWDLSPTMQARPLYIKFGQTHGWSLLRRLWVANSQDLIMDFLLSYVGVVFKYLGPFFLKQILDSLDQGMQTNRELTYKAYLFAFLAFLSTLCKVREISKEIGITAPLIIYHRRNRMSFTCGTVAEQERVFDLSL